MLETEPLIGLFLLLGLFSWAGLLWFYSLWLNLLPARFFLKVTGFPSHVRQSARLIVHCRVRMKYRRWGKDEILLFGQDREFERELKDIVNDFLEGKPEGSGVSPGSDLAKVPEFLRKDEESQKAREMYLRVSRLVAEEKGEGDNARPMASEHELEPINRVGVGKARSDFLKRSRKEINDFWDSRPGTQLFSVSLKEFVQYLPFISVLIIIGGYFHASVLYGYFGIEVNQFFSLDDYVASSIEEIEHALYFVGIYLAYLVAMLSRYRNLSTLEQHGFLKSRHAGLFIGDAGLVKRIRSEYERRERWTWIWVMFAYILFSLLFAYSRDENLPLYVLGGLVFLCLAHILFLRYFENSFAAAGVLLSLVVFFASIYFDAERQIQRIKKCPTIVYEMETGTGEGAEKHCLIGANGRYVFLLEPDKKKKPDKEKKPDNKKESFIVIPQMKVEQMMIRTASQNCEEDDGTLFTRVSADVKKFFRRIRSLPSGADSG